MRHRKKKLGSEGTDLLRGTRQPNTFEKSKDDEHRGVTGAFLEILAWKELKGAEEPEGGKVRKG